jgi:hypothetical protein
MKTNKRNRQHRVHKMKINKRNRQHRVHKMKTNKRNRQHRVHKMKINKRNITFIYPLYLGKIKSYTNSVVIFQSVFS